MDIIHNITIGPEEVNRVTPVVTIIWGLVSKNSADSKYWRANAKRMIKNEKRTYKNVCFFSWTK